MSPSPPPAEPQGRACLPPPSATVAVAVSGGVDSLCALVLLRRRGCRTLALHGLFAPDGPGEPPEALAQACASLGVPLRVLDFRPLFRREVLEPFAAAYAAGRTPNPCALCNRAVKFGAMLDAALALGADRLATGHYARLAPGPEGPGAAPLLAAAEDSAKDQSYFLGLVPRERWRHVCFPLQGMRKAQCRAVVASAGLAAPIAAESQDICFAPGGAEAYRAFLLDFWRKAGTAPPADGPVWLEREDGSRQAIARHAGLWRYTEGQRKGLGIAWSEPLYVLRKEPSAQALVVGPKACRDITGCMTGPAMLALEPTLWPRALLARLRHRQRPCPARVAVERGRLRISLADAQFPTAPGQVAAVYDAQGRLLAAGEVAAQFRRGSSQPQ